MLHCGCDHSRMPIMTYSIIGSGAIGMAVAKHFARTSTTVLLANTRGPASLVSAAAELGSSIVPSELADALKADVVILAVPFEAVSNVASAARSWNGRIVVDTTNAIDYSKGFAPKDLAGRPSSHIVGDVVPSAKVVKTFNTMWARVLGRVPQDENGRRVLFLAGDDAAANKTISDLVESWGFAPLDLGRIGEGGLLIQFGGPLTALSLISQPQGGPSLPEMDLLKPEKRSLR